MYRSVANCEFDKAELMLYEEVTRMPPFRRKTLALIGVSGVGRRTLKNRLVNSDPDRFGFVIPRKLIHLMRTLPSPIYITDYRHYTSKKSSGRERC